MSFQRMIALECNIGGITTAQGNWFQGVGLHGVLWYGYYPVGWVGVWAERMELSSTVILEALFSIRFQQFESSNLRTGVLFMDPINR